MLHFTTGDMFETPADIRVNTVNCVGVMGAGVALAFKNRYPGMFKEYKRECNAERIRPGQLHVWKTLTGDWIINLPTKRHWRQHSSYEDIESGLVALREYLSTFGPVRVALPALGCGHGGLDWNKVSEMIRKHLGDLEAEILVFAPGDSRSIGKKNAGGNLGTTSSVDESERSFPSSLAIIGIKNIDHTGNERSWQSDISIVLSRRVEEREEAAAVSCLEELANPSRRIAICMGTAAATRLATLAIAKEAAVVAWVPQGLSQYRLPKVLDNAYKSGRLTVCSVSTPSQNWNPEAATQCTLAAMLVSKASLIVDPVPEWLPRIDRVPHEAMPSLFYVRYQSAGNSALERFGAKPIGRRSSDGKPNVVTILNYASAENSTPKEASVGEDNQLAVHPISHSTSSNIRGQKGEKATATDAGSEESVINNLSPAPHSSNRIPCDDKGHEVVSGVRWSGSATSQVWALLHQKVLARLATVTDSEISLTIEFKPAEGMDKKVLEDIRSEVGEMGPDINLTILEDEE
jgi:O-acetyl-ADP-ribose deacetylase (regulator of RNase III)